MNEKHFRLSASSLSFTDHPRTALWCSLGASALPEDEEGCGPGFRGATSQQEAEDGQASWQERDRDTAICGAFQLFLLLQPLLALLSTAKSCVVKRSAAQGGAGIADATASAGDRKRAPQRCSSINALLNIFHFYIKYHPPHHPVPLSCHPAFLDGKTRR